jgi:hypothetical protein
MTLASRDRFQVNVPLDDEHWHLVLLQLTIRDAKSVPELLRPVVVDYLKRQLRKDSKLAAAVANIEESRSEAREKKRGRQNLAEVRPMAMGSDGRRLTTNRRGRKVVEDGGETRSLSR